MPIEGVSNYLVLIAFVVSLTIVVIGVLVAAVLLVFRKIEYSVVAVVVTIPFVIIALAIWGGRDIKNIVDPGETSRLFNWVDKVMEGVLSFEGGGILDVILPWWVTQFYWPVMKARLVGAVPFLIMPVIGVCIAGDYLRREVNDRESQIVSQSRYSLVSFLREMRRQQR